MSILPANIPDELIALPQWVLWRYEERDGEITKPLYTCQGYKASHSNPEHWSRFDYALKMAQRPGFADGIGFVFSPDDPYCGIDLDDVWQSDADEGAAWAWAIIEQFSDTYMEASPSDTGMKIWCRAKLVRSKKSKIANGAIEIYDQARYFTVTGRSNGVRVITDHQADIDSLIECLGDPEAGSAAKLIDGKIPYGTQHNTLVSWAGTMAARGMCFEVMFAALLKANELQCERPGPAENIRKIAESAARWLR
jgi:putative DNA primase/helicase